MLNDARSNDIRKLMLVLIAFCLAYVSFQFFVYHGFGRGYAGAATGIDTYTLWAKDKDAPNAPVQIESITYRFEGRYTAMLKVAAKNNTGAPASLGIGTDNHSHGFFSGRSNGGEVVEIPGSGRVVMEIPVRLVGPISKSDWKITAGLADPIGSDYIPFLSPRFNIIAEWTCKFDGRQAQNVEFVGAPLHSSQRPIRY
jgi:hypothetical protein